MEKRFLPLEKEKAVVMGLKAIKALGDCLLCLKMEDIDAGTIPNIGNLIVDEADRVWKGLEEVI